MANKLQKVFDKDEHFMKGTIRFKDQASSEKFRKALEAVYRDGKSQKVSGIESMLMQLDSGAGAFPFDEVGNVTDFIVSPSPEEVKLELQIDGEEVEFPIVRYGYQTGATVRTVDGFPFNTTIIFNEATGTAKININPSLDKAQTVDEVLISVKKEKEFLKKFFIVDGKPEPALNDALNHFDAIYKLFDKIKFIENTFQKRFSPSSIDLDNNESVKDLFELCLLIRDQKVLRTNVKMTDTTANKLKLASDDEILVGKEITMTFMWKMVYSLWGEKITLYCSNLLNNAYVREVENLDDGQIRIIYGQDEDKPMYITYRGFINEADAKKEHDTVMEHKEEYDNAKTVEAYMAEGY